MCFRKKKKNIEEIHGLYSRNEPVRFRDKKGELNNGYIYEIRLDMDKNVIYDIQIGGECPTIIKGVKENEIIKKK